MDCPQCGYVFAPFETNCPRCAKLKAQSPVMTPVTVTRQDSEMTNILDNVVPKVEVDVVQKRTRQKNEDRYEPDIGWSLAITLWILLAIYGLGGLLFLLTSSIYVVGCGVAIAACIAMLNGRRWGFYLYCVFSIGPAILNVLNKGFTGTNITSFAIAIFLIYSVVRKWDRFD